MFWVWLIVFPVTCGLIGWITNVLAVKMIFRPHHPVRLLGLVPFQGVLPKHLGHFASQLASIVVSEFVTVNEMVRAVEADQVLRAIRPELERVVELLVQSVRKALGSGGARLLTDDTVRALRKQFEDKLLEEVPKASELVAERAEQVVDLQGLVAQTFESMGPRRVEGIIYEVSARELRFIEMYGGLFGGGLGFLQLLILYLVPNQNYVVPIVGLLVGAITNYLAIEMLFRPEEPRRIAGGFEWQGLFPKRQFEIATAMGKVAARDVIRPIDVFEILADRILPPELDRDTLHLLEQNATARWPVLTMLASGLSAEQRAILYRELSDLYSQERGALVAAVARASATQVDMQAMVASRLARLEKTKFADIIRGLFEQEETYLVIYGALLGGAIGVAQVFVTGAFS